MARTDWIEIRTLGEGGQGRTVLVRHKDSGQIGVLKILKARKDPRLAGGQVRMLREVANLKIVHGLGGRVPEILDDMVNAPGGSEQPAFVMGFIQGEQLDQYLQNNGPVSLECASAIVMALAKTIEIGHSEGIVHRDLKPQNIMIGSEGCSEAVLLDYGLSVVESATLETPVGEQVGNRFMALPEGQVEGHDHRDPRSDITQLVGLLLYLLNNGNEPRVLLDQQGQPPHRRIRTSAKPLDDQARHLALQSFFDRGFAQRLEERFQSVGEFMDRLGKVLATTSASVPDLAEVASQASRQILASDAKLRTKIALASAKQDAESVRDQVARNLGDERKLSDFLVSTTTQISGGVGLPDNTLDMGHLTISVNHNPSNTMYRISYVFLSKDGMEIAVVRKAHHWSNQRDTWSSPIIWFREPSQGIIEALIQDAKIEIAVGIRSMSMLSEDSKMDP